MSFFVSYSRHDEKAVQILVADLERARKSVWFDRQLAGGGNWWREILSHIRDADLFIFAVSRESLRSHPCLAEYEYARSLGLPFLPVQVGDVDSFRTTSIADKQVIDYRPRVESGQGVGPSAEPVIDLVVAATELAAQRQPLPHPLPAEPPLPYEYLMQIRIELDAEEISGTDQLRILNRLKQALRDEDGAEALRDGVDLLQRLRRHRATTHRNVTEIDDIMRSLSIGSVRGDSFELDEERPGDASDSADGPVGMRIGPERQRQEAAGGGDSASPPNARSGALSLAGATLGGIGLGQFGPLLIYDLNDVFSGSTPNLGQTFLFSSTVLLILTLAGVAVAIESVRIGDRWSRQALVTSIAGFVMVAVGIGNYWEWW